MTCNDTVTIWHYDEETGRYNISHHDCWIHGKIKYSTGENGMVHANTFVVRIPTDLDIVATNGDYIKSGAWHDERPPKESCLSIIAVTDNRVGINPHWRIDAI